MNSSWDPYEVNALNDIQALVNEIYKRYDEKKASKTIGAILQKIKQGGSYRDIYNYTRELGLGNIFKQVISAHEFVMNMDAYLELANKFMEIVNYHSKDINDLAELVQTSLNETAGIKIKPQTVTPNTEAIQNVIEKFITPEGIILDNIEADLLDFSVNLTDNIVRKNAEIQRASGFEIVVIRRYDDVGIHNYANYADVKSRKTIRGARECPFCKSLAKTYNYDDVKGKSEIWRRHNNCSCSIDFVNKGSTERVQNYKRDIQIDTKPKKAKVRDTSRVDSMLANKKRELIRIGVDEDKLNTPAAINSIYKKKKEAGQL